MFTKKTALSAKQQLYNFTDPLNPGGLAYNGKDAVISPIFSFMPKKLDQFPPPISANVTKQKLSLQRGTIQVLRQQRGGWVGWPNADCLRRK